MFPRRKRLSRQDFEKIGSARTRRAGGVHVSVVLPEVLKGYALVVSKKTAAKSVTRHRIKRRVLGVMKKISLPQALVVYPKASAEKAPLDVLRAELELLISRVSR